MGRHLSHLDGIEGSEGVRIATDSVEIFQQFVKLGGLTIGKADIGSQLLTITGIKRWAKASNILGYIYLVSCSEVHIGDFIGGRK